MIKPTGCTYDPSNTGTVSHKLHNNIIISVQNIVIIIIIMMSCVAKGPQGKGQGCTINHSALSVLTIDGQQGWECCPTSIKHVGRV